MPSEIRVRHEMAASALAPGWGRFVCMCTNQRTAAHIAVPNAMRWSSMGSKSARCSLTSAFARRSDVGGRIMIDNVRGGALANDIRGEQALDIGKTGQVTQKVSPSPGSAVSSVTSAHDVTRQGSRPNPR
jgi:hypothetical protein